MSHDPDAVLDCRGQRCPLPVVNLARHLKGMEVGSVLRVLCDDPVAALDIAAWCHLRGQEYLGQAEGIDTDNVTSAYDVRHDKDGAHDSDAHDNASAYDVRRLA